MSSTGPEYSTDRPPTIERIDADWIWTRPLAFWLDVAVKAALVGLLPFTAILWEIGEYFAFIPGSVFAATLTYALVRGR